MCFLKHSISAWGKRKSLWHSPSLDLEGVWYLETSHCRREEKTFWTSGYNELLSYKILWNGQLFFKPDSRKKHKLFLSIFTESWTLLLDLLMPSKAGLKNMVTHLKTRSGDLEVPIRARFTHCITGRMFHSPEEVQVRGQRKGRTISRAMLH